MSLGGLGSFGPGGGSSGPAAVPPPGYSGGSVPSPSSGSSATPYGNQPGYDNWVQLQTQEGLRSGGGQIFGNAEAIVIARNEALSEQFINEYESGTLPAGVQAAITQSYESGLASLSGNLYGAGISGSSSSLYSSGVAELQTQQSIATQAALEQVLGNYFQAQGVELQAAQQLQQWTEFEQQLQLEYMQTWLQYSEFEQQLSQQSKSQMGQQAGGLAQGLGGMKKGIIAAGPVIFETLHSLFSA